MKRNYTRCKYLNLGLRSYVGWLALRHTYAQPGLFTVWQGFLSKFNCNTVPKRTTDYAMEFP